MESKEINCFKCGDKISGAWVKDTTEFILHCISCKTKHKIQINKQ